MTEPNGTSSSPVNGANTQENGGSVEPKEEKGNDRNRNSRSRSRGDGSRDGSRGRRNGDDRGMSNDEDDRRGRGRDRSPGSRSRSRSRGGDEDDDEEPKKESRRRRRSRSASYSRSPSPRRSRSRGNRREGGGGRGRSPIRQHSDGGKKIFIGYMDPHCDEIDLEECFKKYGPIEDIFVPRDEANRCNRGFGFVTFLDKRDALDACAEDGRELCGRRIGVNLAKVRRTQGNGPPKTYVPSKDGEGGAMRAWLGSSWRPWYRRLGYRTSRSVSRSGRGRGGGRRRRRDRSYSRSRSRSRSRDRKSRRRRQRTPSASRSRSRSMS